MKFHTEIGITGILVNGRKEISSDVRTIRFPNTEKTVEEGIALVSIPGQEFIERDYKMIYPKEGGKWLILHVSKLGSGLEED